MLRQWHCRSRGLVPTINIKHVSRPPLLVGGFFVCGGIVRAVGDTVKRSNSEAPTDSILAGAFLRPYGQ
jgi:hypothetical protein